MKVMRKPTGNRWLIATLLFSCGVIATDASAQQARYGTAYADGSVRYGALAKQFNCDPGNPDTPLFQWAESADAPMTVEEGESVEVMFTIEVLAACDAGSASFGFSVEPGAAPGSALEDLDGMNTTDLTMAVSEGVIRSVSVALTIVDDTDREDDEDFDLVRGDLSFQVGRFFGEVTGQPRIIGQFAILESDQAAVDPEFVDQIVDPIAQEGIDDVNDACEAATSEDEDLLAICSALGGADSPAVVEQVLLAISPNEAGAQANAADLMTGGQSSNVVTRMSALRNAAAGASSYNSSVALVYNGFAIDGSMLASLFAQQQDELDTQRVGKPFDGRLGLFLNGEYEVGDRNRIGLQTGFEWDSLSITGGADYRFTDDLYAGLALGYSDFSSDIDSDGGTLDADSLTVTAYASYNFSDRAYLDLSIGQSNGELDQDRVVDLSVIGLGRRIAVSNTDTDSLSATIGFNYSNYTQSGWNWTPHVSATFTDTTIDGFTEEGAGGVDLSFPEQNFESLVAAAGVRVNKAISTSRGVWLPFVDLTFNSETKDRGYILSSTFVDTGTSGPSAFIEDSDSSFGRLDIGATFTFLTKGNSLFIRYSELLGYEETKRHTIAIGGRLEF